MKIYVYSMCVSKIVCVCAQIFGVTVFGVSQEWLMRSLKYDYSVSSFER